MKICIKYLPTVSLFILLFAVTRGQVFGQARINFGNGFMVFTGASASNPVYLNIDNPNPNAVIRNGSGHAISTNEFQRIRWRIGTSTGNYVFPFGANTTEYAPFTANILTAGVGASGYFDVSTWRAPGNAPVPVGGYVICPSTALVVHRFWRIEPAQYTTLPTAHIRFYYLVSELNGIPEPLLKAQRGDLNLLPCPWDVPVGTVNTTDDYVQVDNVSQFSPWTLTHQNFPLPVSLVSFTARRLHGQDPPAVLLEWQTMSEYNNAYFEVERSTDGIHFIPIIRIPGAGNSNVLRNYSYTDEVLPSAKLIYYRLKQTDYDGTSEYGKTVVVQNDATERRLTVFPNPARETLYLKFSDSDVSALPIEITDATGRIVYGGYATKNNDDNYSVNISRLAAGVYILRVLFRSEIQSAKFIIRK